MLAKRGQLTAFVIIGVVIVAGILITFLVSNNTSEATIPENTKAAILRDNTLDCMEQAYRESLTVVGFQGGYAQVSDGLFTGFSDVPYYYKEGAYLAPSLEDVEQSVAEVAEFRLTPCFYYTDEVFYYEPLELRLRAVDLTQEDFTRMDITYDEDFSVTSRIVEDSVTFETDFSVTVTEPEGGQTYTIDFASHPITIASDIHAMHTIALAYTQSVYEDDETICINCLADMGAQHGLSVDLISYANPQDELVVISNNFTSEPAIFEFLAKYKPYEPEHEPYF